MNALFENAKANHLMHEAWMAEHNDALKREREKIIAENNKESEISLSAAVGYAAGKGEDIGAIIKRADDRMYANKIAGKKNRK